MKLWLLEILACPIDHYYPLELEILDWEFQDEDGNSSDEIKSLIERFRKGVVFEDSDQSPIESRLSDDNEFLVRDSLIIKFTALKDYLNETLHKINELKQAEKWLVKDSSKYQGQKALDIVVDEVKLKISKAMGEIKEDNPVNEEIFKRLTLDLEFLNYFKYYLEIKDAVIRCPECNRWYPVIQAIPQMLPDNIRNKESDDAFSAKWNIK